MCVYLFRNSCNAKYSFVFSTIYNEFNGCIYIYNQLKSVSTTFEHSAIQQTNQYASSYWNLSGLFILIEHRFSEICASPIFLEQYFEEK